MSDNLPPLPTACESLSKWAYDAADMRAYAIAAIEADRVSRDVPAAPDGFEWVAVKGFVELCSALERAESKGYLPFAMESEWEAFECLWDAAPQPQPVQPQPSDVDFEAKTCPEAFLQQEISKLKTSLATTVDALEMGLQIGDQCSRGFLAKFHKKASDAITNSQPKPANQQKE